MSSGSESGISNGTAGAQGSIEQMNYELAARENEQRLSQDELISVKFHDKQKGKEYSYNRIGGMIFVKNGIKDANFVVDKNGNFHLGRGHSFLANGESVQAAGTIKIGKDGRTLRVTNLSGHYQPTVTETVRYLSKMEKKGYITGKTWVDIYHFKRSRSGYIVKALVFYSGPYEFLERRLKESL